jgi:hypothetical protein
MSLSAADALTVLPPGLRSDLLDALNEVVDNFRTGKWEPSELNGGKLCEAAFTVVKGHIDGSYPTRSSKPRNMVDACKALESASGASRSMRIQIPRMIVALYEIRNQRGVGHAGGDVNPNEMDATVVLYMSKWIVAELVRSLHTLTTAEAEEVVEALIEREVPSVWIHEDKRRVLRTGLTWKAKTLLLLLSEIGDVQEASLLDWLEHPNRTTYRRDVLRPGHAQRLWEFDESARTVRLLPPGVAQAEIISKAR